MTRGPCHYCGGAANTRDHIVPRSRMRKSTKKQWWINLLNLVPACRPCNQLKADKRSNCDCLQCRDAWRALGPPGWKEIEIVYFTFV